MSPMAMNRVLRRVPLDFDWEIDEPWKGYINPHYRPCPYCDGGTIPAAKKLWDYCTGYIVHGNRYRSESNEYEVYGYFRGMLPFDDAMEILEKHRENCAREVKEKGLIFSDHSTHSLKAYGEILEKCGLGIDWGKCHRCDDGLDADVLDEYNAWKEYDPPTGDGYQMWETTSEGSPVTPVFKTIDGLIDWLLENPEFFSANYTREDWRKIFESDYPMFEMGTHDPVT